MLTCEVCGKLHPAGTTVCDVCGTGLAAWPYIANTELGQELGLDRLQADSELGRVLAEPLRELTGALCAHCGQPNRPGATFCAVCGHTLLSPATGPLVAPAGELSPGTVLARRYHILRRVAQGGMGAVYEASDDQQPGQCWAIKEMVHTSLAPEDRTQALKDFMREAALLASLVHPNLPRFNAIFSEDGKHYLVMEFIPGETLEQLLATTRGFLPESRVLGWAAQLCSVLSYLHAQDPPIIYRDMKPGNVMLVDGSERVQLIDFGIARFHRRGRNSDTAAFGTAGYAPPEQYGNGQTDQRSDVYALAATLHHLLSGHDPVENPFHWRPIRTFNPHVSRAVDQAVMRALELKPELRFESVDLFARALGLRAIPRTAPLPGAEAPPEPATPARIAAPARPAARPAPAGPPPPPPAAPSVPPLPGITPELVVAETVVDFGTAARQARKGRKVALRNAGRGELKGIVHVSRPWLAASSVAFAGSAGELVVRTRRRGLQYGHPPRRVPPVFGWALGRLSTVEGRWAFLAWLAVAIWAGTHIGWGAFESGLAGVGVLAGLLLAAQIWLWLAAQHLRWLVPLPRENRGDVVIDSNGGRRQVEVRVWARPTWLRTRDRLAARHGLARGRARADRRGNRPLVLPRLGAAVAAGWRIRAARGAARRTESGNRVPAIGPGTNQAWQHARGVPRDAHPVL